MSDEDPAASGASAGELADLRARLLAVGHRLYLGRGDGGLAFAAPEQGVLVVGPPRSGKTSSLVIPNVLLAPGAVVVTSTKPDVLMATRRERGEVGRCWLFDPSGALPDVPGSTRIRWSPVDASRAWGEALLTTRAMVNAARPPAATGDASHWTERAEALLAPLLHAAALTDGTMRNVVEWVNSHDLTPAKAALNATGADLAAAIVVGLEATDRRELSGIWSTAAGVLAAYRSGEVLDATDEPNFNPARLLSSSDTVYICGSSRHQSLVAPLVVAFLEQVRAGAYAAASEGRVGVPVTLILDELANIAPLPDLPSLVSEGGSQGVLTLACLQDLAQARARWGSAADGFLSLFGAKVIMPGVGDLRTLQLVSELAGHIEVPVRSTSRGRWWSANRSETVTWSTRRQPRIAPDAVSQQPRGSALLLDRALPPARLRLTPWYENRPFVSPRPPVGREPPGIAR